MDPNSKPPHPGLLLASLHLEVPHPPANAAGEKGRVFPSPLGEWVGRELPVRILGRYEIAIRQELGAWVGSCEVVGERMSASAAFFRGSIAYDGDPLSLLSTASRRRCR
jgi:hypothetical protein